MTFLRRSCNTMHTLCRRATSFRVEGKLVQPRSILETMAGILSAGGASCKPDFAGFSLSAQLPLSRQGTGKSQESDEDDSESTGTQGFAEFESPARLKRT